tara:strand:- start:300 stop:533 length:234 start_codon:yes stop_codon:yes gene_type:complete
MTKPFAEVDHPDDLIEDEWYVVEVDFTHQDLILRFVTMRCMVKGGRLCLSFIDESGTHWHFSWRKIQAIWRYDDVAF